MGGEEGKDGRLWTEKRERMAEYERGRGKGWQSIDIKEGRMAECGRGSGKGVVAVAEGKYGRARTGQRKGWSSVGGQGYKDDRTKVFV